MATFDHLKAQTDYRVDKYAKMWREVKAYVRSAFSLLGVGTGTLVTLTSHGALSARIIGGGLLFLLFVLISELICFFIQNEIDDWEDESHKRLMSKAGLSV